MGIPSCKITCGANMSKQILSFVKQALFFVICVGTGALFLCMVCHVLELIWAITLKVC